MSRTVFSSRRLCLVLLLLGWSLGAAQVLQTERVPAPLAGVWQGIIEIPGAPLEVTAELRQEGQEWQGTIDIPAQGAEDLPLEEISVEDDVVSFAIAGIPGAPSFQGTVTEGEITGRFIQSGQEFPYTLARADGEGEALARAARAGRVRGRSGTLQLSRAQRLDGHAAERVRARDRSGPAIERLRARLPG